MSKKHLVAGCITMAISLIFFVVGFILALSDKAVSAEPSILSIILILIGIILLAVTSFLVFIGITRGDFLSE